MLKKRFTARRILFEKHPISVGTYCQYHIYPPQQTIYTSRTPFGFIAPRAIRLSPVCQSLLRVGEVDAADAAKSAASFVSMYS
jgi:hypothetical protein